MSLRHLSLPSHLSHFQPKLPTFSIQFNHTLPKPFPSLFIGAAAEELKNDATMNELLSRFVHSMRSKLYEAYPNCDKRTMDSMLVVVVNKLVKEMENNGRNLDGIGSKTGTDDLGNEELMTTMWEVSSTVFHEMEKEKEKEENLNKYLQSEEAEEMARFASLTVWTSLSQPL